MESSLGPCKLDHGGLEPNAVAIYEEVMYRILPLIHSSQYQTHPKSISNKTITPNMFNTLLSINPTSDLKGYCHHRPKGNQWIPNLDTPQKINGWKPDNTSLGKVHIIFQTIIFRFELFIFRGCIDLVLSADISVTQKKSRPTMPIPDNT